MVLQCSLLTNDLANRPNRPKPDRQQKAPTQYEQGTFYGEDKIGL
jgi:hypothetical protein